MKYCTKCGAELKDEMLFCYKCGAKFDDMVNEEETKEETNEDRIDLLFTYNLVVKADSINYKEIFGQEEKAKTLTEKQSDMAKEMSELIKMILDDASNNEVDKVYNFVLDCSIELCKQADVFFRHYDSDVMSQYSTLENQIRENWYNHDVRIRLMNRQGKLVLDDMFAWEKIALNNTDCAACIIDALDFEKNRNDVFVKKKMELVSEYLSAFASLDKRKKIIGKRQVVELDMLTDNYIKIINGLEEKELVSIDESVIETIYQEYEASDPTRRFATEYRQRIEEFKENTHWKEHPEKYKKKKENDKEIESLKEKLAESSKELNSLKAIKKSVENEKWNLERNCNKEENKQKMKNTLFKVTKSKKLEEQINNINSSVEKMKEDIEEKTKSINKYCEKIEKESKNLKNIKNKIEELEKNNNELRYGN